jgi:hypothetical protein
VSPHAHSFPKRSSLRGLPLGREQDVDTYLFWTESTELPSSQQIERARLRREELRKAGLAEPARATPGNDDGFVSLQVGFASKGGESRLVREEDEIGDGDEGEQCTDCSLSPLIPSS